MSEIFDLFGDRVPANWGQRGRPEHVASQQNRNRVSMLVAWGWSNPRIAKAMLITLPTLRKHYFSELKFRDVARDRLNANLGLKFLSLFLQEGNVAAGKEFRKITEVNDRMDIERDMGSSQPTSSDKTPAEKFGKKDLDKQRAVHADADLMAELDQEAAAQNAVH